jgi:hypothetical protein
MVPRNQPFAVSKCSFVFPQLSFLRYREDRCQVIKNSLIRALAASQMLASSISSFGQGLCLAVPALQRSLQHLLCLQNSSSSSAAAFASKAKEPPYKKDQAQSAGIKKASAGDKPARAVSAYAFFIKEQASARKGEDGLNAPGMLKRLGAEWKALQDSDKQRYLDLAAKSKAEVAEVRAAKKAKRGPPTAYNTFCGEVAAEFRASQQKVTGPELLREASKRWKALPASELQRRTAEAQLARDAWKAQQLQQQQTW